MHRSSKWQKKTVLYFWDDVENIDRAEQVTVPDFVESVSCGDSHTLIKCQDSLYGFGSNQEGELGYENENECFSSLIEIQISHLKCPIKMISCGSSHSLILAQNGIVYSTGSGKNGVLGYGRGANSHQFQPIPTLQDIQQISAGRNHNLAISSLKVYGWGSSLEGQLGMIKEQIYSEPQELFIFASYLCYARHNYSIFATQKGVYVTGSNQWSQLGLGHQNKVKLPKKINIPQKLKQCMGCQKFIIFQTETNKYYLSGKSSFGSFIFPTKIKNLYSAHQIIISQKFCVKRDGEGRIFTWNPQKDSCMRQSKNYELYESDCLVSGLQGIVGLQFGERVKGKQLRNSSNQSKSVEKHDQIKENYSRNYLKTENQSENQGFLQMLQRQSLLEGRKSVFSQMVDGAHTPIFSRNMHEEERGSQIDTNNQYNKEQDEKIRLNSRLKISTTFPKYTNEQTLSYEQLQAKVKSLQMQNKHKDFELKRIKHQFVQLLTAVESDLSFSEISKKLGNFSTLQKMKNDLLVKQHKGEDIFENSMHRLRKLLILCKTEERQNL